MSQTKLNLSAAPHKVVLEQVRRGGFFSGGAMLQAGIWSPGTLVTSEARALAREASAVVVAVGYNPELETEGNDREFQPPPGPDELIREMAAANKRVIVAVTSGGSVDVTPWIDRIQGLVEVWYPGQEGGTAIADTLLGRVNPSGRLPISWERRLQDNPSYPYYYTQPGTNKIEYTEGIFIGYRGYQHNRVKPIFPFGYGLSYTTFRYRNIGVDPLAHGSGPGPYYDVSFDLTNTGQRAGAEVTQVYVSDTHARVARPLRELKGFQRVELRPGQTLPVHIPLNGRAFTYFDTGAHNWHAGAGTCNIQVGRSVDENVLQRLIQLNHQLNISVSQ